MTVRRDEPMEAPAEPLVVVPARGGSKRLTGKNLALVGGVSLVARAVRRARASGVAGRVYVVTDDPEIARQSCLEGAEVPGLLPAELAGDLVPSHAPAQWLWQQLQAAGQQHRDLILLQPSSALCAAEDVRQAWQQFQTSDQDFLVSVTPVDPHYFHWALVPEGENCVRMWFGAEFLKERPLLPPVFRPNGAIKIARLESLRAHGHFFGGHIGFHAMPEERSVHVASATDVVISNALWAASEVQHG